MLTCPKCHTGVPEGMRFCLQCGSSLAPTAPPPRSPVRADPPLSTQATPPPPPHRTVPTVQLKIAATPVLTPRVGSPSEHLRPSLGDERLELDDETLKKSFARQVTQPGAVVCRFCKGPLDLNGDFCEQCGAPVIEAAPPGTVQPKPEPTPPPPAAPAPVQSKPAQNASPARSATGLHPSATPPPAVKPAAPTEATHLTPTRTPAPVAPPSPPTPPAEEQPSGLMGRLKGIFKKG